MAKKRKPDDDDNGFGDWVRNFSHKTKFQKSHASFFNF